MQVDLEQTGLESWAIPGQPRRDTPLVDQYLSTQDEYHGMFDEMERLLQLQVHSNTHILQLHSSCSPLLMHKRQTQ